jgi:hypothetical protein
VIDDLGEQRYAFLQPLLAVLVVEEARVLEPRPHHALVAADDVARIGDLHVRDDEELRRQLAGASNSGKYFWFCRMVRIRHSCGTSRNALSNRRRRRSGARPAP